MLLFQVSENTSHLQSKSEKGSLFLREFVLNVVLAGPYVDFSNFVVQASPSGNVEES